MSAALHARGGRPKLSEESRKTEAVRVRLTASQLDELCREALTRGRTVAAVIRERLFFGVQKDGTV